MFVGGWYFVGQVVFVENDQCFDFFVFGGEQGVGDQVVGKGWFGGYDNDQLVDVGGNQFLFVFVGVVKQVGVWLDCFDDVLVVGGVFDVDVVVVDDIVFFVVWKIGQ